MKKRPLTRPALILTAALALLVTGCSGTKYGAVNISSEPSGAEVVNLKDNTNLGKTPTEVVWSGEGSEQVTIQFHKNGYHSAITSFWVNKQYDSKEEAKMNMVDVHSELNPE